MAHHEYQVALHNNTGLPEDDAVNILFFDINFPETVAGTMADIATVYQARQSQLNSQYQGGMTIKAYEPGPGGPVDTADFPFNGTATPSPAEVALCLSYSAVDDSAGPPRRRGRIYLPFGASTPRPTAIQVAQLLLMGQDFAQVGTAGNTTWKMFSRTDQVFAKIESISVDDAWDTQRRRGLAPMARTRQDVQ